MAEENRCPACGAIVVSVGEIEAVMERVIKKVVFSPEALESLYKLLMEHQGRVREGDDRAHHGPTEHA